MRENTDQKTSEYGHFSRSEAVTYVCQNMLPTRSVFNWALPPTFGESILLYIREDIPAKVVSHDFLPTESFFVETILHKKKWLVNSSYNPHKSSPFDQVLLHEILIAPSKRSFC